MTNIQYRILVMQAVDTLDLNFLIKFRLGSLLVLLPLDKFAIGVFREQSSDELFFAQSRITIEVHPPDDLQHVFALRQVPMLPQERLKVLFVDETIAPVIDLQESLFIIELLAAFYGLLLLLHGSIERYLEFNETRKLGLNIWLENLSIRQRVIRPLSDVSSQTWLITRHYNLKEVVENQVSGPLTIKVFHQAVAIRLVDFFDLVLAKKIQDIHTINNTVLVPIYPLKRREGLKFWQRRKFLPLVLDHLLALFKGDEEFLE